MANEIQIPQTSIDLNDNFKNEDFVIETCQQLNKDLVGLIQSPSAFNIDLEINILEQLVTTVSEIIGQLDKQNIMQFLYKVDLNENKIVENIEGQKGLRDLAFLVVKREAQKVFLRRHFS